MLYMTCPTCGYFIGQKILYYEEMKEKICLNPNLNQIEKEDDGQSLYNRSFSILVGVKLNFN